MCQPFLDSLQQGISQYLPQSSVEMDYESHRIELQPHFGAFGLPKKASRLTSSNLAGKE
jgi:hypothetical protein